MLNRFPTCACLCLTLGVAADAAFAQCDPYWDTAIGQPGTNDSITGLQAFDAPTGPELYVYGFFTSAGGIPGLFFFAQTDGQEWESPWAAGPMQSDPQDSHVFDDGSGPAVYFAGDDAGPHNILRGEGNQSWTAIGWPSLSLAVVYAITSFDDGSGPTLYASGNSEDPLGIIVAKWLGGQQWSIIGFCDDYIHSMQEFKDALYVGGWVQSIDGVSTPYIGTWDGEEWSGVGENGPDGSIRDMVVFDDGSGPALYVAAQFENLVKGETYRVAKWDGETWSPLNGTHEVTGSLGTLVVFDDGSGPALYAAGSMTAIGDLTVNGIAKWDGNEWFALDGGVTSSGSSGGIGSLEIFDDGSGPALFVGGTFEEAGGQPANNIAAWRVPQSSGPADLNCDGVVGTNDLFILLGEWGPCADCDVCSAVLSGDCTVGIDDLFILLSDWG